MSLSPTADHHDVEGRGASVLAGLYRSGDRKEDFGECVAKEATTVIFCVVAAL